MFSQLWGNRQHHPSFIHHEDKPCDLREGTHQAIVIERRFSQRGDNQTCGCRIARHGHIHLDGGKGIDGDWFLSNYTKRYGCWWRCVFHCFSGALGGLRKKISSRTIRFLWVKNTTAHQACSIPPQTTISVRRLQTQTLGDTQPSTLSSSMSAALWPVAARIGKGATASRSTTE